MEHFFAWAIANPELSGPLLVAAMDIVAGWLPDKYIKWPGLILAGANRAYNYGKELEPVIEHAQAAAAAPESPSIADAVASDPEATRKLVDLILAEVYRRKHAREKAAGQ